MRTSSRSNHPATATAVFLVLLFAAPALAQLNSESLNPNPMLPAGVGSGGDLEEYHHGSSVGSHIGQAIGGRMDGADKNPADIMLRDIGGTNRGRRTGRAIIRGRAVRNALRVEGATRISPLGEQGAVYFARRGDYENAIYAPSRGSYRTPVPARPAARVNNAR